jgi:putative glycosyltransferase (TIGR04372 family)
LESDVRKLIQKLTITKVKSKIKKILTKNSLNFTYLIANSIHAENISSFSNQQSTHIKHSGIFGKSGNLDIPRVYRMWNHADELWRAGNYQDSVQLRGQCLDQITSSQSISDEFIPANFMSVGWTAAMGHLGYLGVFIFAQELGIAPNNHRQVPVRSSDELARLKILFQEKISPLHYAHAYSILEHPSQWHQSERLSMIRTESGPVELHQFVENVFSHPSYSSETHKLNLPDEYLWEARKRLGKYGLPADAWFVSLHVREKPYRYDPRDASISNYTASILEITSRGGWVIRFGTGQMTPLPKMKNVIDLCPENFEFTYLHLYLLAKPKFLLVTTSGPMELAKSLGTPVLGTNTTSVARNMQSATPGTLYIPKKWYRGGRKVSFAELLSGTEGYSENDLKEKYRLGYTLEENSPQEISEAVVDMFTPFSPDAGLNLEVNAIRTAHNSIAWGNIAPSYLASTAAWFLNS